MLLTTPAKRYSKYKSFWASYAEVSRFVHSHASGSKGQGFRKNSFTDRQTYRRLYEARNLHQDKHVSVKPAFWDTYKNSLSFPAATHRVSDFLHSAGLPQEEVVLHGYLGSRTDLNKNFYFVPLFSQDLCYSIQIVSSAKSTTRGGSSAHEKLKTINSNSPVVVRGLLKARHPASSKDLGDVKKIKSVEVELRDVQSLNQFPKDIIVTPDTVFRPEQRHLQIRFHRSLRDAIVFRAEAASICKHELSNNQAFTDIETPILFKSTPEGAREFVVPTRRKGLAYALPQSPQQFKQMLMASGISKYYQLARCFRDEDLRADRQPEFTQLDLEMSFASRVEVTDCIESLIRRLWYEMLNVSLPDPFPSITYEQAMSNFGSDKPDLRLGMIISDISYLLPADLISKITPLADPTVEVMMFQREPKDWNPNKTRKFIGNFMSSPEAIPFNENPEGQPGIFIFDSKKPLRGLQVFGFKAAEEITKVLRPEDGDLIILQARKTAPFSGGSTPLGNLRLALHKAAVKQGYIQAPTGFKPLWITDFPLFSPSDASEPGQGGTAGLASTHHPFTSPKTAEDVDLLLTNPSKVIGEHYDLVINGVELGGGSRRIHNFEMQKFILENILQMKPERIAEFSHLLEALRAGCPPHAGIALGFDRLVAVMLGKESVRDVIAFPKSGKGEDVLVKAPMVMSEDVLKTYHLKLRNVE